MVLETTKGELVETETKLNEHKTENEALQRFIGVLTKKLEEKSNILQQTKHQLKEAKEESELQKGYLERRTKEGKETRKAFDDRKAFLERETVDFLSKEASVLKEIEDIVSSAEVRDAFSSKFYSILI